ncbi:four helix bundle protein [uncultured Polaribacter sp.]|uniref:four helix bundle protein n=1 Tax=uncultured Polaribacter sp. TaxID=174711 RepID=UPI00262AA3F5|nr:four helix bundle protein [uncultured Polaribacter sp.]
MKTIKFKFEDLKVYQKSLDFVDTVYNTTKQFLSEENYRLTSQFIRAATSISLNIAEESGDTNPQFSRFFKISLGSIKECVVCVTIVNNQNFITKNESLILREKLAELSKMITALLKYLNLTKD